LSAESILVFSSSFAIGDFVFEEMRREEVTYARAVAQTFVVN
jgi:hypothetical protein